MVEIHEMPQGTIDWFKVRLGKVTGSVAKDYFNIDGKLKSKSVIEGHIARKVSEIILGYNDDTKVDTYDMSVGREMEDAALMDLYEEGFSSVGFITNSDFKHFGVSPDAVYINPLMELETGVEVKSPSSHIHTKYLMQQRVDNIYKAQIGFQFIIMPTIDKVVYRSYNPNFKDKISTLEIIIKREDWSDYLEELKSSMLKLDGIIDDWVLKINK